MVMAALETIPEPHKLTPKIPPISNIYLDRQGSEYKWLNLLAVTQGPELCQLKDKWK